MTCDLCKKTSRIIYSTRKYGEICNECMCEINNSEESMLKKELEIKEMHRRYGLG